VHRKEVYEAIRRENEQAAEHAAVLDQSDLGSFGSPIAPTRTRRPLGARLASTPFRTGEPPPAKIQTNIRPAQEREPVGPGTSR
jgi:hypothetical protein